MKQISRSQLKNTLTTLNRTSGFFSVVFVKKNGEMRKMTCKIGVQKHKKNPGKPSTTAHIPKYITVFDVHKKGYRNINLETIDFLKMNRNEYFVN